MSICVIFLLGCQRPFPTDSQSVDQVASESAGQQVSRSAGQQVSPISTPTLQSTNQQIKQSTNTPTPQPTSTPIPPTETPFYSGIPSTPCGQTLPLNHAFDSAQDGSTASPSPITQLPNTPTAALENLQTLAPDIVWPAIEQMIEHPETVGLAIFQLGNEANGVYLNAEQLMPVASLAKTITLAAYAEAVVAGELNPNTAVSLETLEDYYLPNFDLGAHPRALRELHENERLLNNETAVSLEDVAWMMMRHSSNAAADYLHRLLGQERIEATAVSLGFTTHGAPCTFLGQFLAMGNHTSGGSRTAVNHYIDHPDQYQQEVELFADAFINQASFQESELAWRSRFRGPSVDTQRLFSHELAPQATPLEYAQMMARLAQNGLNSPESSFVARRIIEWPMQFETNQERFTNLGYKNGSLPGILTTTYYAYRSGESAPIVIALFYKDLPNQTYRIWRRTLPDDEFARWVLAEPDALPALKSVINP
ncbi:MAG: serine hydrolase [Chloroflexota bacterium]